MKNLFIDGRGAFYIAGLPQFTGKNKPFPKQKYTEIEIPYTYKKSIFKKKLICKYTGKEVKFFYNKFNNKNLVNPEKVYFQMVREKIEKHITEDTITLFGPNWHEYTPYFSEDDPNMPHKSSSSFQNSFVFLKYGLEKELRYANLYNIKVTEMIINNLEILYNFALSLNDFKRLYNCYEIIKKFNNKKTEEEKIEGFEEVEKNIPDLLYEIATRTIARSHWSYNKETGIAENLEDGFDFEYPKQFYEEEID